MQEDLFQGQVTKLPFGMRGRMRFGVLLAAFLVYFLYSAISHTLGVDTEAASTRILGGLFTAALLCSAALAVSAKRSTRNAVRGFLLFILVLVATSKYEAKNDTWDILAHMGIIGFVAWVSYLTSRNVWALRRANSEAIAAALCAFLMLGLLWSYIYSLLGHLDPNAFPEDVDIRVGGEQPVSHLYFSYVTLTTLGYGDISPVSSGARMFAILEAIVGQIFLVVFVARLVGLSIVGDTEAELERRPDD